MESSCSRVRACEASDNCQFQYRLNSIALLSNSKTIVSRSRFPSSLPCSFPFSAIFRTLSLLLARACACVRACVRVCVRACVCHGVCACVRACACTRARALQQGRKEYLCCYNVTDQSFISETKPMLRGWHALSGEPGAPA